MDKETQERIKETMLEILKNANLEEMTFPMVWKTASEKLDMDLSKSTGKKFVRQVVESFMSEQKAKADHQEEEKVAMEADVVKVEANGRKRCEREYDDDGGIIICRLSKFRRVKVHDFHRKTLVTIREYYSRGGKEFPTPKGISLTCEQWESLKKNLHAIDKAIMEMESI